MSVTSRRKGKTFLLCRNCYHKEMRPNAPPTAPSLVLR